MATKYCRADGSATWADANGPESSSAACCSLSTATGNAAAGDTVIVSGLGGVYREAMYATNSGSSGSVITYQGSNSPEVNAADIITGWSVYSGSVYRASLATEPEQVWINGTFGDRKTSSGDCIAEYDWYWASSYLYLYAPGDPDTQYTSPGVEAGQRNHALSLSQSYLKYDGITFGGGNTYTCLMYGSSNITFDNCIIEWGWLHGLISNASGAYSGIVAEDSTFRYNGSHAAVCTGDGHSGHVFRRCDIYENGTYQGYWDSDQQWTGGIKLLGQTCTNCIIEQNKVHDNGPATPENGVQKGWGIWLDYCTATDGNENIVRHNCIYDNQNGAIFLEVTNRTIVAYNVGWNNAPGGDAGIYTNSNIRIDCRSTETSNYNKIYNNTFYGGRIGFLIVTFAQGAGCVASYNELKNNILVNNTTQAIWCDDGGDNDGTYGTGNVYESNCFGAQRNDFIYWAGTNYDTYDAWLAASSQTDNNVEADPQFADADNNDYSLASGSPCIGAGLDLGASYDDGLMPSSTWPSGVVTGDQDDY
jgi:hypothetical protein